MARLAGRIVGWSGVAAIAMAAPAQIMAQTYNPAADRYTPFGSPLDPNGTGAAGATPPQQAEASATAASQSATRVEPDEIVNRRARATQEGSRETQAVNSRQAVITEPEARPRSAPPNEFETYVERALGRRLPRFGAELLVPGARDFQAPPVATVPSSYILGPGDEVFVGLTGSVDATLDLQIDNSGRVFVPRVGAVRLAGVSYGQLRAVMEAAISQQYRDFRVTTSVTRLRGVRVYVTGYANQPGAYTVSSLSTMVNAALAAGGPAAGGSFRSVKLFRNGALVSDFDLYDLLLKGDKSRDAVLQNEDVLYISPVGPQVAVTGSVNAEAIYETKPGESLEQLVGYAGGTTALADADRVILYRLSSLDSVGGRELPRGALASTAVEGGDLVQVLSSGSLVRPLERQSVVVRVEGEVLRPGNYYVPANTSLEKVMEMAGGVTRNAFVFGTSIERLSVRVQQRQAFREALNQLEFSLAAAPLVTDSSVDPTTRLANIAAARAALNQLRAREPDGRMVLPLAADATALPRQLLVENSDRIYVPPRPATVGVFGAVYRPASFLYEEGERKRVRDYLVQAGGPARAADKGEIFVVRANGAVISRKSGALNAVILPGDVIFVPVRTSNNSVWTRILQAASLVFQLGLTAATVVAVTNN